MIPTCSDDREIVLPPRIVEERGQGVFIKKRSDVQHILDHQAKLEQAIKLGLSVRDEERTCEFWFAAPVIPAQTMEEYEQYLANVLQDLIQNYSSTWAVSQVVNSS
jgi:hypothetical protein